MKVKRIDKSSTEVILEIEVSSAELEPIHRHVLHELAPRAHVPGFRAGKAPAAVVEKHLNQQLLLDTFLEHALSSFYSRVVDSEKLRPIAPPKVTLKKFVPYSQLVFETETSVIGAIRLPNYKIMKLAKPKITVSAKDITATLKALQTRTAERQAVERPAKAGDEVVIDFAGRDKDDQPINGATGKDYPLLLGSKSFIPGFEENLTGLKASDEKEFQITFPGDYSVSALQNKQATFKIMVKKVNELIEPTVDDAWATKVGPFKNLVELKADIKKQLSAEQQWQADRTYENQLIQKIVAKAHVDIPEALIDDQLSQMEEEERRNLSHRGQTWQEHLTEEGITADQHRQRHRPQATERVKAGLILSEIAAAEKIEVSPEEVESRLQNLKAQYKDAAMQVQLDKPEAKRDITSRILTEKTLAKLVGYASK